VVLSEALDEKAIDILIDLTFWKLFPSKCDMWRASKKDVREKFKEAVTVRTEAAHQDLLSKEESLRHSLREAVVDHVMKLFP
jgi:agmatine/peptidylarginine deiminase